MAQIKAERFAALKAKVKAECLRRSHSGSVAGYGGAAYDYTTPPTAGGVVRQEHRSKLAEPLSAINSNDVPKNDGQARVSEAELAAMETKVTAWAARSLTDTGGSDCLSGCTGTCYTGCATGCTGCGSGCPSACTSCGSGCPTSCTGCGSGCPTSCSSCGSGCGDGCSGCGDGCTDSCSGCGDACSTSCSGICSNTCYNSCDTTCGSTTH